MNDDLERLEALYHDIIVARAGEPSDSKMWDCLERLPSGAGDARAEASVRSSPLVRG